MILPVKGYDVVLGVQWLSALGPVLWNFTKMSMQFNHLDQWISLNGIHPGNYEMATE